MKLTITSFSKVTSPSFPYLSYVIYHLTFHSSTSPHSFPQDKIITSQPYISFRYSELNALNEYLQYKYSKIISKANSLIFPSKSFFQTEGLVIQRMKTLENYFNYLFSLENNRNLQNDIRNYIINKLSKFICANLSSTTTQCKSNANNLSLSIERVSTHSNDSVISSPTNSNSSTISYDKHTPCSELICSFLIKLEKDKDNISSIIKAFENENKEIFTGDKYLDKEDIYTLFFGQIDYLKGLIFYLTDTNTNQIGKLGVLEFIFNLINYERNSNCDLYRRILQLITRMKVNELNLQDIIYNYNCNSTSIMCYEIVSCLCEIDEFEIDDFFSDSKLKDHYIRFINERNNNSKKNYM